MRTLPAALPKHARCMAAVEGKTDVVYGKIVGRCFGVEKYDILDDDLITVYPNVPRASIQVISGNVRRLWGSRHERNS